MAIEQTNNVTPDLVFEGNSLVQPTGVAVDSNQNFYVSSEANNQVYEYTQPVPLMRSDLLNLKIGPGAQNPNAASLQFPMGLAIDAVNNLYVADQANNRVLEFNEFGSPGNKVANGAGGQIDRAHNGPNLVDAIGENSAGRDRGGCDVAAAASASVCRRHREQSRARLARRHVVRRAQPADIVLGQPDLFSYKCNNGVAANDVGGLGADSLCGPARMAVDQAGNLYVADSGNNRVLVYNTPFNAASGEPGAGDATADFVYGQGGAFTTRSCNPSGANATTLVQSVVGGARRGGNIYIADAGNNRVLEFAKAGNPPGASDAIASRAYGQGAVSDFTDTQCADGVAGDPSPSDHAMCNAGRGRDRRVGEFVCRGLGQQPRDRNRRAARGHAECDAGVRPGGRLHAVEMQSRSFFAGRIDAVRAGGIDARRDGQPVGGGREQRSRARIRGAVQFGYCGGDSARAGRRR